MQIADRQAVQRASLGPDDAVLGLLQDTLREILACIEAWEFQVRVGFDREEAIALERRIGFVARG